MGVVGLAPPRELGFRRVASAGWGTACELGLPRHVIGFPGRAGGPGVPDWRARGEPAKDTYGLAQVLTISVVFSARAKHLGAGDMAVVFDL